MVKQLPTVAGRVPEKLLPMYLQVSENGFTDSEIVRIGIRAAYSQTISLKPGQVTA